MKRTYRMEPVRQRLFILAGLVLAGMALIWPVLGFVVLWRLELDVLDVFVVGIPTAFFLGVGLLVAGAGRSIRLELAENGIVLRVPGGSVEARWEDVDAVGLAAWGPLSGQALILRRAARVRRPWWALPVGLPWMERAIPLSPFALPLRGSRLEADLKSRLPDLFD